MSISKDTRVNIILNIKTNRTSNNQNANTNLNRFLRSIRVLRLKRVEKLKNKNIIKICIHSLNVNIFHYFTKSKKF